MAQRTLSLDLARVALHAPFLHKMMQATLGLVAKAAITWNLVTNTTRQLRITGTLISGDMATLPHPCPSPRPRREDNGGAEEAPLAVLPDALPPLSWPTLAQVIGYMLGVHFCPLLAWFILQLLVSPFATPPSCLIQFDGCHRG